MNKLFACMIAAAVMTVSAGDAEAQYRYGGGRSGFGISIGSGFGGYGGGFNRGFYGSGFNRGFGGSGIGISVNSFRPSYGRSFGGGGFYGGGVPVGLFQARFFCVLFAKTLVLSRRLWPAKIGISLT